MAPYRYASAAFFGPLAPLRDSAFRCYGYSQSCYSDFYGPSTLYENACMITCITALFHSINAFTLQKSKLHDSIYSNVCELPPYINRFIRFTLLHAFILSTASTSVQRHTCSFQRIFDTYQSTLLLTISFCFHISIPVQYP